MKATILRTVAILVFGMTSLASAGTLLVANNGTDSGACGPTTPCRTISQAITNAVAGDTIKVGPGRYGDLNADGILNAVDGDEVSGTATKMILINKALTVVSTGGAAATIIDSLSCSSPATTLVSIEASGVKFGAKGKGFAITEPGCNIYTGISVDGSTSGVTVAGNRFKVYAIAGVVNGTGHTVKNNMITGYYTVASVLTLGGSDHMVKDNVGEQCTLATAAASTNITLKGNRMLSVYSYGFDLQGSGHVLKGNIASSWGSCAAGFRCYGTCGNTAGLKMTGNVAQGICSTGFEFTSGTGHVLTGNLASQSTYGFYFGSPMTVTMKGNEASVNYYGVYFASGGVVPTVTKNAFIGNRSYGIYSSSVAGTISMNNIYGNDASTNCGIALNVAGTLSAQGNYWGAGAGPGSDPADLACNMAGIIDTSSPAAAAFPVSVPRVP